MLRTASLALRNLLRNRRRTLATMCAILFGVAAVVALQGFFNGFIEGFRESVVLTDTGAIQIHRKGYLESKDALPLKLDLPYDRELLGKVRAVPGVKAVSGRITFGGLVSNGRNACTFVGTAVDPEAEPAVTPLGDSGSIKGHGLRAAVDSDAVFGSELAGALKADLGSTLTLSSSDQKGGMNALDVTVAGTIFSSIPFENKAKIKTSLALAERLLKMEGRVTELALSVEQLSQVDQVAHDLQELLGPEYQVNTWDEIKPIFRSIIFRQKVVLAIFTAVLFVITLTIIINTMLMNVTERVREIGTMMALGMKRASILRLFLSEAGALALLAGFLGAGLGLCGVLYMGWRGLSFPLPNSTQTLVFRPYAHASFLGLSVLASVVGTLLAALYPAWRASRLRPVDALHSL